jgi:hypothetical protein
VVPAIDVTGAWNGPACDRNLRGDDEAAGADPGTGVALEQFSGTVNGRRGTFTLAHRGTMTKVGVSELDVRIAPDSGTDELTGISGSLKIDIRDGKHYYELTYTLP